MKKFFGLFLCFAAAATVFSSCNSDDDKIDGGTPDAPIIKLVEGDIDAVHEIVAGMTVRVQVAAPGGIARFGIDIDSPALTAEELGTLGLAPQMDLAAPASEAMATALKTLGFPVGAEVKDATTLEFDISRFIPMIAKIYPETSDHKFKLTVRDNYNQETVKTLKFHLTVGEAEAPVITLVDADIDAVHEIVDGIQVKVRTEAEAGIASFLIDIDSPALTAEELGTLGLAPQMDLAAPASEAMATGLKTLGFPVGDEVKDATTLEFDISRFIPMIAKIYPETSDHKFKLTVRDNQAQQTIKTLKFHLTVEEPVAPTIAYNEDADLWTNTASFTVNRGTAKGDLYVEYRLTGSAAWLGAEMADNTDGTLTARIAPMWEEAEVHPSGASVSALLPGYGIFAGQSYEYRLMADGQPVEAANGTFEAAAGQAIPYGDMDTWGEYNGYYTPEPDDTYAYPGVSYPCPQEDAFWGNGNNMFTKTLCTPSDEGTGKCALLKGMSFGVYAAGNLFTGKFDFVGAELSGYARFGQVYDFQARPRALRFRYRATVNPIGESGLGLKPGVAATDIDKARIFVCITDWTDRHSVCSGLVLSGVQQEHGTEAMIEKMNPFDPETDADPAEGKVIAYGSLSIDQSTTGWQEYELKLHYKDREARPADGHYSLVISCASSAFGDYLCGNMENELYVDDFQWVY